LSIGRLEREVSFLRDGSTSSDPSTSYNTAKCHLCILGMRGAFAMELTDRPSYFWGSRYGGRQQIYIVQNFPWNSWTSGLMGRYPFLEGKREGLTIGL